MLKGKKAVIFDLDGTLIDSLGIWSAVDELLVTSLGRPDLAADPVTLARLREDALVRHALESKEALQKPLFPSRIEQNRSVRFFFTTSKNGVFLPSK